MKTKSFDEYLKTRFSKEEIAEIKDHARREAEYFKSLQTMFSQMIDEYMKKNKIGFNDLVRQLDWSPTKLAKIQRGEANLTMASIAHLFAFLDKDPKQIFLRKK